MVREINRVRTARDLDPVSQSQPLERASHRYARWLVVNERFRHAANLLLGGFSGVGEVLARHHDHGEHVRRTVRLWMRSPTHRRVLLNPRHQAAGAALVQGRLDGKRVSVWVLRLGHR